MSKVLLVFLGVIVVIVCVLILAEILMALLGVVIYISIIVIVVGGAFLILRSKYLRDRECCDRTSRSLRLYQINLIRSLRDASDKVSVPRRTQRPCATNRVNWVTVLRIIITYEVALE